MKSIVGLTGGRLKYAARMSLMALGVTFGVACASVALAAGQGGDAQADLILRNGQVYTPTGWAEAVAVRDGVIVAVGDNASVQAFQGAKTAVLDLKGDTVLPGLHDMHVHPLMAGLRLRACKFAQGSTPEQIFAAVSECVKDKKRGEWVTGGQFQAISFGDTPPNKEMLDAIAPNNPVVLTDISGHSAWANSAALKLAKIDKATPNPEGGVIERDASGEPTGLLRESAAHLVRKLVPPPSAAANAAALKVGLESLLSYGVTSVTDAVVDAAGLKAYAALGDQGQLHQRIRGCVVWGRDQGFDAVLAERKTYARPGFAPDCVKIFVDGVPTESHTAAMLEPYAAAEGHADGDRERGMLLVEQQALNALVTRFDALGLAVKFHAAGDWAARAALDAVAAARAANGLDTGERHDVGHLTFIKPDDMARAESIRATLEYSPYLWYPSPINDDIIKAIGDERIDHVWPVHGGLRSGSLVIAGSDWSVVPSANPWIGIETLVTRKKPGGEGETYGGAEAITLKEAIDLFTINAAKHRGVDAKLGTIETGKLADLIVLDRNPFKIPVTDVHNTGVKQVIVGGATVHQAGGAQ